MRADTQGRCGEGGRGCAGGAPVVEEVLQAPVQHLHHHRVVLPRDQGVSEETSFWGGVPRAGLKRVLDGRSLPGGQGPLRLKQTPALDAVPQQPRDAKGSPAAMQDLGQPAVETPPIG